MLTHLASVVDRDKTKDILLNNGASFIDLGASYYDPRWLMWYEKVSNGYNFRYRPLNNSTLDPSLINVLATTITDVNTSLVTLFDITLPPGGLGHGDTVEIDFTATGDFTNGRISVENLGQPTNSGGVVGGRVQKTTSGTAPNVNKITYTQIDGSIINCVGSSGYVAFYAPSQRLLNALDSIKITVKAGYTVAGTGSRSMTFPVPTVTFKPNQLASSVVDMANYRKPDVTPYASGSLFNNKLDTTATYGVLATNPMSILLRDVYAGYALKSGPIVSNTKRIGTVANDGAIPIHYLKDTDPIVGAIVTNVRRLNAINSQKWDAATKLFLRMPAEMLATGQSTDRMIIFISPDKRFAYETANYSYDAETKQVTFGTVLIVDLYGYGYSERYYPRYSLTDINTVLKSASYAYQLNYRGSGIAIIGGLIRQEELEAGVIPHMISFQLDNVLMKTSQVLVQSSTANSFTVKPIYSAITSMDYVSLFTNGTLIAHNGMNYTCNGTNSYNASTNETTIGVTTTPTAVAVGIKLVVGQTAQTQFDNQLVWPCSEVDSIHDNTIDGYMGLIPMGQVFAIPPTVDVNTLGLTPTGVILAKAMQDYGMILTDVTGETFLIAQCTDDVTSNYYTELQTDQTLLVNQLVPVTNWSYALAQASINNVGLTKPKPLPPIYMAVET